MEIVKLMNMCKIINPENGKVLVQERVKSWQGIAFPGGKVELGESIIQSVKREVWEETGLEINNLQICGIKDWYDAKTNQRDMIVLFKTSDFSGTIKSETPEGKVYWIDEEELKTRQLADDFEQLLKIFSEENLNEMVYIDNKSEDESKRWELKLY